MEEVGIFLCIFRFFGKLKQSNGNYYVRTITIRIAHKKEHLGLPLFLLFALLGLVAFSQVWHPRHLSFGRLNTAVSGSGGVKGRRRCLLEKEYHSPPQMTTENEVSCSCPWEPVIAQKNIIISIFLVLTIYEHLCIYFPINERKRKK